jgi:acyl-CoA thioesterase-1
MTLRPLSLLRTLAPIILVTCFMGCASAPQAESVDETGPAQVLIIGDSISIGYFEPTKELLADVAEVYHNVGNAQHTAHGLARLDEWLGDTRWDVIHFNHGLHDLKYIDEKGKRVDPSVGRQQIPIEDYRRNLDALVRRLKKTRAKLIFATTTPVPEGAMGRVPGDSKRYNAAALAVMKKRKIPVNDLYAFALARLDSIQRPRDVHFTKEGSRLLAEEVARHVREALED